MVAVLSPVVGGLAIALSLRLSGTSWESVDDGSSTRILPLLALPLWGAAVHRRARRLGMGTGPALAFALLATAWSLGSWWVFIVLSAT